MTDDRKPAGELTSGREVVQVFRAPARNLTFVSPVLATYKRQNAGDLTMSLHRVFSPNALGRPTLEPALAEVTVATRQIIDNDAFDFRTSRAATRRGEWLAIRIATSDAPPAAAPTVWLTRAGERIDGHVACFVDGESQGEFGLHAATTYGDAAAATVIPRILLYSPVSQCNLNCIHCISAHTRKAAGRLSADVKDELRRWCAAGQIDIILSDYSGDILWADHRFGGELDFLLSLGVPVHIDTNGAYLTASACERLCRAPVHSINVSLDAATEETYRRVRKGAPPLIDVLRNIAGLLAARTATGAKFAVSTSFTLMRSTLTEWPDFLRMSAELGVERVIARHLEAYTAAMEPDSLWHDQALFNQAREAALALADRLGIALEPPPPFTGKPHAGRRPCAVPWSSAVILANGDVAACCVPGLVMGNLHEATMEEVWNGPRYRHLRATVNSESPLPPCAACPIFRHADNRDSYLIHSAIERAGYTGFVGA